MATEQEWRIMAGELYFFIQRHCTPSGMTPEGALQVLDKYLRMLSNENSSFTDTPR